MKIICHDDTRFSRIFAFGASAPLTNLYKEDLIKLKEKGYTAVVTGMGRLRLISKFEKIGMNYFFIDRGYLFGEKKHWLRICYNSLQLEQFKKIKDYSIPKKLLIKPWNHARGDKIIICPPSKKTGSFYNFDPEEWTENVSNEIKKYSDKNIIIRKKPEIKTDRYFGENSLKNALKNAHCIVVFNSNAATEAIIEGIPAVVLGPAASRFISETKISNIENLQFPDRENWIKNLMRNQFTKDEIGTGYALKTLKEFYEIE